MAGYETQICSRKSSLQLYFWIGKSERFRRLIVQNSTSFVSVLHYVHRNRNGLLGTGSSGRPPQHSHSSWTPHIEVLWIAAWCSTDKRLKRDIFLCCRKRFYMCTVDGWNYLRLWAGEFCLQSLLTRGAASGTNQVCSAPRQFCHSVILMASRMLQVSLKVFAILA